MLKGGNYEAWNGSQTPAGWIADDAGRVLLLCGSAAYRPGNARVSQFSRPELVQAHAAFDLAAFSFPSIHSWPGAIDQVQDRQHRVR
jgi:hypothetical protein